MNDNTYTPFNVLRRIDELRALHDNMSIYRLSKESGIPQSTINTWYRKNYYPPIDKIEVICHVFKITLSDFFYQDEGSEDLITMEDRFFLRRWHRMTAYQRELLGKIGEQLLEGSRNPM